MKKLEQLWKEKQMDNKLDCEDCKQVFLLEEKLDYDCIFQNGICSKCLVKRVERGLEW